MWVEPDTNVPSGESLVRQLVHGKRFFADEFGVETHELWIPDVFGYSAALPQIARQAGVTGAHHPEDELERHQHVPPHHLLVGGPRREPAAGPLPPGRHLQRRLLRRRAGRRAGRRGGDRRSAARNLYPFGYGDGGGGPTDTMLERFRRMADLDGLPRVELGTVGGFLDRLRGTGTELPVWVGRALPRGPPGHADHARRREAGQPPGRRGAAGGRDVVSVRRLDRPAPAARRGLEAAPAPTVPRHPPRIQHPLGLRGHRTEHAEGPRHRRGRSSPRHSACWPGRERVAGGDGATTTGAAAWSPSTRPPPTGPRWPNSPTGRWPSSRLPACGWSRRSGRTRPSTSAPVEVGDGLDGQRPAAGRLGRRRTAHLGLGPRRRPRGAGRRPSGQPVPAPRGPPTAFDAWDVDRSIWTRSPTWSRSTPSRSSSAIRSGPRCAFTRTFGASTITQTMRLAAGSGRIEFHTEVDWHERHRFLKVAFPVAVRSTRATYEIQHGHIERPTVANTSWDEARFEVCGHRWADLSEPGYGVALLNDCKYGYDIVGRRHAALPPPRPRVPRSRGRSGPPPVRLCAPAPSGRSPGARGRGRRGRMLQPAH